MATNHQPLRLLSLDGGGIRGYSTLLLLKAIFEELEGIQGHPSLPCEVFDMIAGTSTGGLIAVMLGPLRMNITDCIDSYLDMAPKVFPVERRISRTRPAILCGLLRGKERFDPTPLETFLQDMIAKHVEGRSQHGKDTSLRFEADKGGPDCKVFLCAKSQKFGQLFRFRNYHVPGDLFDCPLWKACRATSAAPTIFPPIGIGKTHVKYIDGGVGANNPIGELIDEATTLWHNSRDTGCIVSLGTGVPAMTDFGSRLVKLVPALVAMSTDTERIHHNFEKQIIKSYGLHQSIYFRFNVERGLEHVSLEEWKQFDSVEVATNAYIDYNRHRVRACAEALTHPIMPPPPPSALLAHCMPKYMVFRDRRSENFVQRKVYSEKIEATFHDANSYRRHVAIYGLPGMGKSQLMFHYVREHHTKYHAVFAADASKLESVGLSFNEFFDELKLPKCYDDDQSHRVNAVLQWMRKNTQWLLIFDNLQQKDYNRLKKSYFPQGDFGHIMVTTRSEWAGKTFGSGAGNLALHVEELEHGTAVKLLLKSAQLESQSQDPKLQELASELVTQLWHLPLTIEFVGKGHTSQEQLVQLLKVLKNTKEREAFMAVYTQDDEPLGYDQMTPDGTTSFLTLYTLKSVSARTQDLWNVMAYLDPTWYAESLFRTVNNATTVPLGHIVSDANALSTSFGDLYTRGVISRTDGKDGYWTHDQLHQIARVALRGQFGKEKEYATIAASWISTAFPNYNEFQRKWIHNREYLKHALTCIGFCEELQIRTPDLQRLYYKSSNYARFIGDYPTAESLGRKAIQLFDASVGDRRDYFKARDSLALALRRVNKFDEAKEILRESLKQQEQELEKDDPDTLSTLNELGWATYLAGDAEAAEPILRDAKERRERRLGEKAGVTQHTYQNLAACLTKLGKYEEAEGLYQRAFEGHKELFGTEDQHWVQHIKSNIARLYEAESRLNEAMDYFRGVKEWREKNVNFGPDHPDTLRVCVSLARVYHKLGRRDDAIQLAMKTRDKYVKVFGDDHPETKELKELIEEMSDRDRADVTIFQIPPSHP